MTTLVSVDLMAPSVGEAIASARSTASALEALSTHLAILETPRQWRDVKSSRLIGATYTNNTPVPIEVIVCITGVLGELSASTVTVGGNLIIVQAFGVPVGSVSSGQTLAFQFTVPPDATYLVSNLYASNSVFSWYELRQ